MKKFNIELTWEECFAIENALAIAVNATTGVGKKWYDDALHSFSEKWNRVEDEQNK